MISLSRLKELAEEEMQSKKLKCITLENDDGEEVIIFSNEKGDRYIKNGHNYCKYISCEKCRNASWYDDDYCNNQKIIFVDKNNCKTTSVYCENYEP